MRSGSSVLRFVPVAQDSEKPIWVTRLGLMVAYREEVLAPTRTPYEPHPTGFDAIAEAFPSLQRHRIALNARRLGLSSLTGVPFDVLLAACRGGKREELARLAGLFYALTGVSALAKTEYDNLASRFGADNVAVALAEAGAPPSALPSSDMIECIGLYAVRVALSQIPALAGWEALQPVALPDCPLDRARLLISVRHAARRLGLDLP